MLSLIHPCSRSFYLFFTSCMGLLLCLTACEKSTTGPEEEISASLCKSSNLEDDIHVYMLSPNGGERFHIGDTIQIKRCSENPSQYSLLDAPMSISIDGGENWEVIYPKIDSTGANGKYVIPETSVSVDLITGELIESPMTSSACYLRTAVYLTTDDFDVTDGSFTILEKE